MSQSHLHSMERHPLALASAVLLPLFCIALTGEANALTFDVEFRDSNYSVQGGDSYDDLVLEHQSGTLRSSVQVSGIDGLSSVVSANTGNDYSTWIATSFTAAATATYTFQIGTDWGRGGASKAVDLGTNAVLDEFVTTDDIWWAYDWSNPDVMTTVLSLQQGEHYSMGWVGFEGCCGGDVTFRFSVDGSPFAVLDDGNFSPYEVIPEPTTASLLAIGLLGLAVRQRAGGLRGSRTQRLG